MIELNCKGKNVSFLPFLTGSIPSEAGLFWTHLCFSPNGMQRVAFLGYPIQ